MPGYPTRKLLFGGPETLTLAGAEAMMVVVVLMVVLPCCSRQHRVAGGGSERPRAWAEHLARG